MNKLDTLQNLCFKTVATNVSQKTKNKHQILLDQLPNIEDIEYKLRCHLSQDEQLKVWPTLYKVYDKNGKLRIEKQYKNSKKDGLSRYYTKNDNLEIIIEFQNDKKHGVYCKFWPDTENIKELKQYNNGLLQGDMRKQAKNGDFIYWANYHKGVNLYEIYDHGNSINDRIKGGGWKNRLKKWKRNINIKVNKIRHFYPWVGKSIKYTFYGIGLFVGIPILVLLIPVGILIALLIIPIMMICLCCVVPIISCFCSGKG